MTTHTRQYELDWLRVLAFTLLILYHIGMYYVADWGWHIKSDTTFVWLQDLMILPNQWRMSLLFLLSFMALALVVKSKSKFNLARLRTTRLLVPLLFGMFVVVAPQVYIEALSQDLIEPNFGAFWSQYINPNTPLLTEHHSIIGLLTWNHLWFLPYLWFYSLIFLALIPLLEKMFSNTAIQSLPGLWLAFIAVIGSALIWLVLRREFPVTHDLVSDWYNHARYLWVCLCGFAIIRLPQLFACIKQRRVYWFFAALMCFAFLIMDRNGWFPWIAEHFPQSLWVRACYGMVASLNHWAWLFTVVGFAATFLIRPNKIINYANQMVLPWYILHQTLIIVIAWHLKPLQLNVTIEFILMLTLTMLGCLLGGELVRRLPFINTMFGLSSTPPKLRRKNLRYS